MTKTIFIVDDEKPILMILPKIVRTFNSSWDIRTFENPVEALRAASTQAPHLVLTDQSMPQMAGSEFLPQLRLCRASTRDGADGVHGEFSHSVSSHSDAHPTHAPTVVLP